VLRDAILRSTATVTERGGSIQKLHAARSRGWRDHALNVTAVPESEGFAEETDRDRGGRFATVTSSSAEVLPA